MYEREIAEMELQILGKQQELGLLNGLLNDYILKQRIDNKTKEIDDWNK